MSSAQLWSEQSVCLITVSTRSVQYDGMYKSGMVTHAAAYVLECNRLAHVEFMATRYAM